MLCNTKSVLVNITRDNQDEIHIADPSVLGVQETFQIISFLKMRMPRTTDIG